MSRLPNETFKDWKDGDVVDATDYVQELEIIRTAVNANYDDITTLYSNQGGKVSGVPSGTTFPTSPKAADIFYRTDQDLLYVCNASLQWVAYNPKSLLDSHIANDGNPHNVTAAQVGSYSKAEADNLLLGKVGGLNGYRLELVGGLFFTNGSSPTAQTTMSFAKSFTVPPNVFPGNIGTPNISYSDVIYHPYVYDITTTGFSCKLTAIGNIGSTTPTNMTMNFLAIGS